MRVLLAVCSLIAASHAYDAVLFSNQREIRGTTVADLVRSATAEEPVVFIVNPDFTLGQFSVKANAYSSEPTDDYLTNSVKSSAFHESQFIPNQVEAATAQVITSADQYQQGSAVYIVAGEEWTSMGQLAEQLLTKFDNAVGIVTSTDAVSHKKTNRVKRVATDEMDVSEASSNTASPAAGAYPFPLVLPPYNNSDIGIKPSMESSCLFYLEGITVVVQQKNDKTNSYAAAYIPGSNLTYSYAAGDVSCVNGTIGEFIFRLRLTITQDITGYQSTTKAFTVGSGQHIDLSLNITGDLFGYWSLSGATLHEASITGIGSYKSASVKSATINEEATQYSKINSVAGWSLVCGQTQAVFFPSSESTVQIGIALMNTQIQTINWENPKKWLGAAHFTLQAEDCQGTFSPGSWMGIVSSLVLIAGLLFGYVMLQSVQTMDRFDDPKQKQIVINVRE